MYISDMRNDTSAFPDLRILKRGFSLADKTWETLPLNWWFWRLYYFDETGISIASLDSSTIRTSPDYLYLVPPKLQITRQSHRDVMHLFVHFLVPDIPSKVWTELFPAPIEIRLDSPGHALVKENIIENSFPALPALSLASWSLSSAFKTISSKKRMLLSVHGDSDDKIEKARNAAIEKHGNLQVSNMAAICGYSPDYFTRAFRKLYGVSPSAFLKELKINEAARLLISKDLGIEDIADVCGFSDRFHFSKAFKMYTGFTPAKFRHHHK